MSSEKTSLAGSPAVSPRRVSCRRIFKGIMALFGLIAVAGLAYWWFVARFVVSTDNAYAGADIAIVSAKIDGLVQEVLVDENQPVRAGDVLVRLRDVEQQAHLREAEAAVTEAEARYATLQAQRHQQQAMIDQAQAQVASAAAERQRAAKDYGRVTGMQAQFVAGQKRDLAQAELTKADAALAQNQAALNATVEQISVLDQSLAGGHAALLRAQAQRDLAAQLLKDTEIKASFDGVIGNKGVRIGQYVRPGQALMAVVPLSQVYVTANFKETQIADLRVGQKASVRFDAFPDTVLEGRIDSFAPASGAEFSLLPPENATGNFTKVVQRIPVRITLPANHALVQVLRPGLSADVSIDTSDND